MNSVKNEKQKLPDGWILCKSKSNPGRKYYFNKKTGTSSWTVPQADEKSGTSKQKSKNEEVHISKVCKKEVPKKNLKRKTDCSDNGDIKKKQKQETKTPEEHKPEASKIPVKDIRRPELRAIRKDSTTSKTKTPNKLIPTKNIANSRLEALRSKLNEHTQSNSKSQENISPTKSLKHKFSPKIPQIDSLPKIPKLRSPHGETKSSTTPSPSSDSIQSMPSPSQFFAANKIISSMKAQLPEKFCNNIKPKDTFADIEQGICNQTLEYPISKHPATPPQFSEASKLVSAIKSKLSYKATSREDIQQSLKTFSSAKERLETLRTRLSNEAMNEVDDLKNITLPECTPEAMDVEDCKEVSPVVPSFQSTKEKPNDTANVVLVVDTNIFIHELDMIKNVINSHIKGYSEQPTLLVPWRVVNELDRLKDNNNGHGAICKRARNAMDYLYKSLPEDSRIKGQSLRDANSHIYPCELPDDEILNCCLQQSERGKSVILLSNDKNLCNKATINSVKCISLEDLKPLLEHKPVPTPDPDLYAGVKHYESTLYQLLANILENEMRAKYNNLWQHVIFKAPPWSLADVLQCLLKHWVAVFDEVFPRIEHILAELKNALVSIQNKDPKSLNQSEVSNFQELCLDIAKKCQIIPEYMELAKATVEKLQRKTTPVEEEKGEGELAVIDAFEGLWTVFSSYCAKLCAALGIPHGIEDKLPGDEPLPVLSAQWGDFSHHIVRIADSIKGCLHTEITDLSMESHVRQLQTAIEEGMELVSARRSVPREDLRVFCVSCRNMLQEAHTKFYGLMELLDVCKNHLAIDTN